LEKESYKKLINDIIKAFGYERGEIQEPVQLHEQEWGTEEVDAKNDGGSGRQIRVGLFVIS
jgi:hypothetical protein